ncbi:MAG: response regulator [Desulfobacterales bacterium]|nr:response regulator [Desulfobacterales bacterium]
MKNNLEFDVESVLGKTSTDTLIKELASRWPNAESPVLKKREDVKLLVVDDDVSTRMILKSILENLNFKNPNIAEAENGAGAIEKLKNEKYDIIISDWNMPGITGLSLIKTIKSVPGLKNIPFIMQTALSKKEHVIEAFHAGISGYILKPVTQQQVEKIINKLFP